MNKKIMKRSLALSALMAFVITGSALAAPTPFVDLQDNDYDHPSIISWAPTSPVVIKLNDYALTINSSGRGIAIGEWPYQIEGSELSQLTINSAGTGLGNRGTVDIGTLNINADSGFAVEAGGNTTITASDITLNVQECGLRVTGDAYNVKLDVNFKESLTINGVDGATAISCIGFNGSSVSVNGYEKSTLVINTDGKAVYAGNDSKVYINTELNTNNQLKYSGGSNTTITGAIEAQDSAQINLGLKGEESKITGKVVTGENATTNLILEGGTWSVADNSAVSKIIVNGNVTIDGTKADGSKSSLTSNRTMTNASEYFIEHTAGTLTINNLEINNIVKVTQSGESQGAVIKRNGTAEKIIITNSEISNNKNVCGEGLSWSSKLKPYAILDIESKMDVVNTKFLNNETGFMGGALYLHNKEFNISGSTFDGNTALQGAAIQSNSATINFTGNTFKNNIATKDNDGDCGGAICAQGTGVITFKGTNTFEGNKATGKNGCGGAIAQYNKGTKIVFEEDSYTEFTNNTTNGNGGAIWNGADAIIEVNGDLVFKGNTAGKQGNDIYNKSALKFLGGNTKVSGGIVSEGANAYVEISNDAVVELNGGTTSLNKLQGKGGIIHFTNADAQLAVEANTNETLKFTATSAVNEAVAGDANKLISQVAWADDTTMVMEAGEIVGEVTAKLGKNKDTGKLIVKSQTEAANPANQAISDAGVGLKLHYRYHMNDMNKRMGELRNANGEHGVWTRMVRGESEYENSKAQYNQYQLGYDEKLSVDKRWTVGAAVTFSEGDASYGYGSTEDKSTAFAIYGSKLNNDGTFVDLIARYAHLESDVDDQAGKADYGTNGMSVSAEFGKRIQQGKGLWIEPQVELTYGTLDSAELQLDRKTVQIGDIDSLIGRVGFRIGQDIEKGNVYARASYLYDFDGETTTTFSNATAARDFKDDLGGGWWEVGVGANINLSKATYIYADVEKTFGGEVDTNWQWNLGVRYSF